MMTIEEHTKHRIDSAQNDLTVAEDLFNTSKYDWCLFIGHLVIEKTLKALYIQKNKELTPPKIHNLLKLASASKIELSDEQLKFFDLVNNFHLEGRYPEFKNEFYKIADKEFAQKNIEIIKETYLWLKSHLK